MICIRFELEASSSERKEYMEFWNGEELVNDEPRFQAGGFWMTTSNGMAKKTCGFRPGALLR